MTHEDALNKLLANSCGFLTDEELQETDGMQEYVIELHCSTFIVTAKALGDLKYEIQSVSEKK